jgi:hypothetical protein
VNESRSDATLAEISHRFGREYAGIWMEGGRPFIAVTLSPDAPAPELPAEYEGLPVPVTGRDRFLAL